MLHSRADAQDLVHALFVDMLQRGEDDVDLPYLYRAVTNRCLGFLRDESNRARLLSQHGGADDVLAPVRTRCDDRAIDLDLLLKLVTRLDDETLSIVVFRYLDDLTQEEIASMLGISRKTVGKKLDKVRELVMELSS